MSDLEFERHQRNIALRAMWVARAKIRNAKQASHDHCAVLVALDREPIEAEIDATVSEEG